MNQTALEPTGPSPSGFLRSLPSAVLFYQLLLRRPQLHPPQAREFPALKARGVVGPDQGQVEAVLPELGKPWPQPAGALPLNHLEPQPHGQGGRRQEPLAGHEGAYGPESVNVPQPRVRLRAGRELLERPPRLPDEDAGPGEVRAPRWKPRDPLVPKVEVTNGVAAADHRPVGERQVAVRADEGQAQEAVRVLAELINAVAEPEERIQTPYRRLQDHRTPPPHAIPRPERRPAPPERPSPAG